MPKAMGLPGHVAVKIEEPEYEISDNDSEDGTANKDDGDDQLMIFSITDLEDKEDIPDDNQQNDKLKELQTKGTFVPKTFQPLMTLKQRRRSLLLGNIVANISKRLSALDSGVDLTTPTIVRPSIDPLERWQMAVKKIHTLKDPWKKFKLYKYPAEKATRHRYNALTRKWVLDDVIVKMENEPFNSGAMRTCYRLKKLSKIHSPNKQSFSELTKTISQDQIADWSAQSRNYVAKRYMENVSRDVYMQDVQLQMDAKLWGEEYNRHRPPKQVDILQMSVLEFRDRPSCPLYHLENFIDGDYKKYNSNSGFVEEESLRMTPQAFSHFTFERSSHHMIVVDIQGVGDLWTDPQIHTSDGVQYGDGNLGTRGMALFFYSHVCNNICRSLGLTKFDLYEEPDQGQMNKEGNGGSGGDGGCNGDSNVFEKCEATQVRGIEECIDFESPPQLPLSFTFDHMAFMRDRVKTNSSTSDYDEKMSDEGMISPRSGSFSRRNRNFLSGSESSAAGTMNEEEERRNFQLAVKRGARPSCVLVEMQKRSFEVVHQDSVLGKIHHDLAKYHEIGRFVKEGEDINAKAALFHEQQAADLGVPEAALTMAYINLGMPHDVLASITIENENKDVGFEYMRMAADNNDRKAMIFLAKAFETGVGLPENRSISYLESCSWYERALKYLKPDADDGKNNNNDSNQEFDSTMDDPTYQIKASLAGMYLRGGNKLERNATRAGDLYTEAAEEAMEAMKGKLANKFYALAEEAYAAADDDGGGDGEDGGE